MRGDVVEFCGNFIVDNNVTVTAQTLQALEDRRATFQDLVDCLEEDGAVIFDLVRFEVDDTINVRRAVHFLAAPGSQTQLICNNRPLFDIRSRNVEMSRLTVRNCQLDEPENADEPNSPIIVRSRAGVTLQTVSFANNTNTRGPAVIDAKADSTVTIIDSLFDQNIGRPASVLKAGAGCRVDITDSEFRMNQGRGGVVVLVDSEQLDVSDCNFTNNVATHRNGGAIRIKGEERVTTVAIESGSTFEGNRVEGANGGALSVLGNVSLTIETAVTFRHNSAALRGGAVFVRGSSDITIDDATFLENDSNFIGGGAIFAESTDGGALTLQIRATIFSRNVARNYLGSGGGLRIRGDSVTCIISDSTIFSLNQAQLDGGGMHVSDVASLSVASSSFLGNEALLGGGSALSVLSRESFATVLMQVAISNSTFSFNRAMDSSRGGGNVGMTGMGINATIADCLFNENESRLGSGGALYFFNGPSSTILRCEFVRNNANRGGAVYAQEDVRTEVRNSRFDNNTAEEGGAVHTRGDVDLTLTECLLTNNFARTEGGAIKMHNFATSSSERSFIVVHNCTFEDNQAGSNLFEDRLYGTETAGGALLLIGNGVDIEIMDSNFTGNKASNGGAVNIEAVAECNIASNNIFKRNRANFGGAVFLEVDENVRPSRYPMYFFNETRFIRNEAEEGGGMYVGNGRIALGETSFNARRFIVRLLTCVFRYNRAERNGGAFTIAGTAAEIRKGSVFKYNRALPEDGRRLLGRGGAIRADTGAVVQILDSVLDSNSANIGGAINVFDSSVESHRVVYRENNASLGEGGDGGVGGAVALEVSPDKDIPVLNTESRLLNMIFEGFECSFDRNLATLRGGAIHLHHIDPGTNISLAEECGGGREDSLSCISRLRYVNRLRFRSAAFQNVNFTSNAAQAGGAIFTNDVRMINASVNLAFAIMSNLIDVWGNETYLEQAGLRFEGNSNNVTGFPAGYGPDFATTPTKPVPMASSHSEGTGSSDLVIETFFSGDRLNFTITFEDAVGQPVNIRMNLTALIVHEESSALDLSGQLTAEMDETGKMSFTGTRLRGEPPRSYTLRINYEPSDDSLTYVVNASTMTVTMQRCRIGERTVRDGSVTECQRCPVGTFGKYPRSGRCEPCADIDNGDCNGETVVPDDDYWHATSTSLKMHRCIGAESCDFKNRKKKILEMASAAHLEGRTIYYINENRSLCEKGYTGPLCGSCEKDYGRVDLRCRKCAAPAWRALLLIVVIMWAIAFLSYFVKSVLDLPARIEFNNKFLAELPALRGRMQGQNLSRLAQMEESLPGTHEGTGATSMVKSRTGNLGKRLAAIISDQHGENVRPLTLANPVAEVLKILINFLQVTAAAVTVGAGWTDELRRLLITLGLMGNVTSGQSFLSLDCFMDSDDDDKALRRMTITVLQPLMFFCVYVVFWALAKYMRGLHWDYFNQRVWLTFLAISYFVYTSMTKNILRFLACADISDDDVDESQRERYWEEDTAVKCYTRRHAVLVGLMVVPLLFAFTIGYPLGTFCILFYNQKRLQDDDFVVTYGFLYRAYNKSYWEVVIMLRKAAIATVSVFAHFLGQNLQGLLCVLIMILALGMHLTALPFTQEIERLNGLETVSLSTTIVVFVVGLMINDPKTNSDARALLTVITFVFVVGALCMMMFELFTATEEFVDMKIIQYGLMEIPELIGARLSRKAVVFAGRYTERFRHVFARICNCISGQRRNRAPAAVPPAGP